MGKTMTNSSYMLALLVWGVLRQALATLRLKSILHILKHKLCLGYFENKMLVCYHYHSQLQQGYTTTVVHAYFCHVQGMTHLELPKNLGKSLFWIHLFVQFFSFLKFCRTRPFGPVSATPFICIPWKPRLHVYAVLGSMMQSEQLMICIELKNTTFDGEHTSNTKEKLRPTW